MWGDLLLALVVAAALLYGPGYAFFRGMGLSRLLALTCAPLYGVAMYASLPIAYYELGIACSVPTVLGPTLALALGTYAFGRMRGLTRTRWLALTPLDPLRVGSHILPFDIVVPALFAVAATIVCAFVFLGTLPAPDAFMPRFDNVTHLNLTRAFMDSGKWSSLHNSNFLASPESMTPLVSDSGFYPAGWNCVVALTCLASGVNLPVVINALVVLMTSVMFPLSMYVFMRALLPDERRALLFGPIAITCFAHFPWLYVYTGPLYPNLFGIAVQFAVLALLMLLVERHAESTFVRVAAIVATIVTFVGLSISHPTTVFSMYVFMVCYGGHYLWVALSRSRWRLVVMAGFVCAVVGFWVLCYQLPMLHSVIAYVERERIDLGSAIAHLLLMDIDITGAQVCMLIISLAGVICVARRPGRRWMLLPLVFFSVGYVSARIDWWDVKHWVAALWYTDQRRMSVNLALFLMPVAALGLAALFPSRADLAAASDDRPNRKPLLARVRAGLCVVLVVAVYLPSIPIPNTEDALKTPYGTVCELLWQRLREPVYPDDKIAFVDQVVKTIPEGSLVINAPNDGSMWSYAINGLNTMYRDIKYQKHTADATVIRKHLREYAVNGRVREAGRNVGATYVLRHDQGVRYEEGTYLWQYNKRRVPLWAGITTIQESTPGFTCVLAEREHMRLYRIDPIE